MAETRDLLVEIGTEELPPKALAGLAEEFDRQLFNQFKSASEYYYSPRRIAVIVRNLPVKQESQPIERSGPAIKAAYDKDGKPTKAAEGFARSCGVSLDEIKQKDGKLFYSTVQEGKQTADIIPDVINNALSKLPIPKRMRWGDSQAEFIRPVHWVVVLFGHEVIPCEIMGVQSGNKTFGHRFHHPQAIELMSPDEYRKKLKQAKVWVNETGEHEIQQYISTHARKEAEKVNGVAINSERESDLVSEIAALVEWPISVPGSFDKKYLALPRELLISVLEDQQRYFAVEDKESGKLLPYFIAISNIESKDKEQVRKGNERVIVPRLSDAMFFWETDRAKSLESRYAELDGIVFQKKLGTVGDKTRRVIELARLLSEKLKIEPTPVMRAAKLAKCDLVTDMVNEFPELQGITGKYLAQHDGEPDDVAQAIEEHYLPRFAGDKLPETDAGQIVALADKIDTLAGIFGIGQQPTAAKDPFALRRAALGVIRILVEKKIPLSIGGLVKDAFSVQPDTIGDAHTELVDFILDRARGYFIDKGYTPVAIESVLQPAGAATLLYLLPDVIVEACAFIETDAGKSLAESNKRITNILKKSGFEVPFGVKPQDLKQKPDEKLFDPKATVEQKFWHALQTYGEKSLAFKDEGKFAESLRELTNLATPTRDFFDNVMVNVEDEKIRDNRITLLQHARTYMNQVADISLMTL